MVKARCFDLSVRDLIIRRSKTDSDLSCQGPFELTLLPRGTKETMRNQFSFLQDPLVFKNF